MQGWPCAIHPCVAEEQGINGGQPGGTPGRADKGRAEQTRAALSRAIVCLGSMQGGTGG